MSLNKCNWSLWKLPNSAAPFWGAVAECLSHWFRDIKSQVWISEVLLDQRVTHAEKINFKLTSLIISGLYVLVDDLFVAGLVGSDSIASLTSSHLISHQLSASWITDMVPINVGDDSSRPPFTVCYISPFNWLRSGGDEWPYSMRVIVTGVLNKPGWVKDSQPSPLCEPLNEE